MPKRAASVKDVSAPEFINAFAQHLKRSKKFQIPAWTELVKTGVNKELAPYDEDWYYIRAASIARKLYIRRNTGVGAFRRVYGGSINRGTKPAHVRLASGKIIRTILQQFEDMKLVKHHKNGRYLTPAGHKDLDTVASNVINA